MKSTLIYKPILLLALVAGTPRLHGEAPTETDPYTNGSSNARVSRVPHETAVISFCYEVFSLPLEQAASIQREQISDGELYKRLVSQLKAGSVKQEVFTNIRVHNGEMGYSESILEQTYPTNYETPKLPKSVSLSVAGAPTKSVDAKEKQPPAANPAQLEATPPPTSIDGMIAPATPTAFDTRNTGETLQVEPLISEDSKWIDVRLVPEQVLLVGEAKYGQGLCETTMPVFETRRINTSVRLSAGKPYLLGTLNRPSNSQVEPDSANRVSYAFVTASIANP